MKATEMDKHIFFLLLVSIVNITARSVLDNYYWLEYKGVIPTNALPAGYGENDQLIYIGQAIRDQKFIPGKIYENDDNVYFELGEHGWSTNESVKIFCTDHVENFEWIPITLNEISRLRDEKILVNGGYEEVFQSFIGRVHLDGRTEVGKVVCRKDGSCLALYVNEKGNYKEYNKFEILSYNPDIKNTTIESVTTKNTTQEVQPILQNKNHF